jgi:hypothetical protein
VHQIEGLVEVKRAQESCDFLLEFTQEKHFDDSVENLVSFVAKEGGAAGINIDDGAVVGDFDAHEDDGVAGVGPVLQHDLFVQSVLFLHIREDRVVHGLIVFDSLEIVDEKGGDLLTVGDAADQLIVLLYFSPNLDAFCSNLV